MTMNFGVEIPFVDHLGFELTVFEGGQSEIVFEPRPEHLNSFAVTHGGALMTLLDVTMAVAARSTQPDMGAVTIEMKTSFFQPAVGKLSARGAVDSSLGDSGLHGSDGVRRAGKRLCTRDRYLQVCAWPRHWRKKREPAATHRNGLN